MSLESLFEGIKSFCCGKQSSREEVPISEFVGQDKVLGIYFSSYWCKPCRLFTPKLVEWYTRLTNSIAQDKLEIVLVCDDENKKLYDMFFDAMPWLALPYSCKETVSALTQKFHVTSLPTLVLIDCQTGLTISRDGCDFIDKKPNGEGFPWQPNDFTVCLPGDFINSDGASVIWKEVNNEAKVLGIYFSASKFLSCVSFNTQLTDCYRSIKEKSNTQFEIIFVSMDETEVAFKQYQKKMPWLAVPYEDDRRRGLKEVFEVNGIPMLILVDLQTNKVITDSARAMVQVDPEGKEFPWYPKAVKLLHEENMHLINDNNVLIWFTDGSTEQLQNAVSVLTSVTQHHVDCTNDNEALHFLYANKCDVATDVREALDIPDAFPKLLIFDPYEQIKYYCESEELNEGIVNDFIKCYNEGTLNGMHCC